MFKRLFLGTTQIDFKDIGPRFYKIFVAEIVIFGAILIASVFGVLSLNLSVDLLDDIEFSNIKILDIRQKNQIVIND